MMPFLVVISIIVAACFIYDRTLRFIESKQKREMLNEKVTVDATDSKSP